MPGLLYTAYQKFYSAISALERFDKEQDFFDNISSLDTFFSEYRNITFAIQSSLRHTEHFSLYEKCRDKYLTDHWFIDKRNEVTKQQPFQLVKQITLTIFLPFDSVSFSTKSFTVEDDVPLETIKSDLKDLFSTFPSDEIFFSSEFSFFEKDSKFDLWDKLISGISTMQQFMDEMYVGVGENCDLCNQLRETINKSKITLIPRDFWLVNDYVYYPIKEEFERAGRIAMVMDIDNKRVATRRPLKEFTEAKYFNYDGTPYGNFILMHAMLRAIRPGIDIMPVIMVIYNDNTYDMDAFHADIKTTVYRKINEVARRISYENIKEVYFMSLYACIENKGQISNISKERVNAAESDILVFMKVDENLNEEEIVFDGSALEKIEYIACVMKNGRKNKLEIGKRNMWPIISAFKKKMKSNTTYEQ